MQFKFTLKPTAAVVMLSGLLLVGCFDGGGGGSSSKTQGTVNGVTFKINSAGEIAQVSADDYDQNVNGLITAATLKRWKDDWATEKAKLGLTGKLIILQLTAGPAGARFVRPNGVDVFTYLSPSSEWTQVRDNGVIESVQVVPDGAKMDTNLKNYNIDPHNDMIVVAMGTGSNPNAMSQGRVWYALRYWGMDKKNLAILNGGNQWIVSNGMTAADFQDTASVAPNNGTHSVKSLLVDNTQLQATIEDMIRILPGTNRNNKTDGVLIWDARSMSQYSAGEMVEFGEDTDSDTAGNQACATAFCAPTNPTNYMWTFQNGGSRQGHPRGTLQVQYTHFLDPDKGFSYRPKAFLAKLVRGGVTTLEDVAAGNARVADIGFVDGSYSLVGEGNGYQPGDVIYAYCETTFRAMITGVASAVILGLPTRFYDGAMVEWNSLSHLPDRDGKYILPANSPWRTDLVSFFRPATSSNLVAPRTITNAYSSTTSKVINEDKAYKTGEAVVVGGGGGGGALPGNPCGG